MSTSVLAVLGSGRPAGNSARALTVAADAARGEGAEVELLRLGSLGVLQHCIGCKACRASGANRCVLPDGFADIVERARGFDSLLIAAPVYFFSFGSLAKAFIDRAFYSSIRGGGKPNLFAGRKAGLILTYMDEDVLQSGAANAIAAFRDTAGFVGLRVAGYAYARIQDGEDLSPGFAEKCASLGRLLAS